MNVGIIAKLSIRPDRTEDFEAHVARAAAVYRQEPGILLWRTFKSRKEPGAYIVLEVYKDEAAFQTHMASEHLRASRPHVQPMWAAPPEHEIFDAVGD